ncbi:MAG TPA: hypothetical protein VLR46_07435 [Candidatus Dormibacteraeota bacterium]|nr:hypothetical protein [Candidatus Dormibacteraeota bacterium]
MTGSDTGFVAECFWVGVADDDLRLLDERAAKSVSDMAGDGARVRYLGSVLMRSDEVVLCFFEGSAASVRRAAVLAQIPFERILETAGSPWAAVQEKRIAPGQ